MDLYSDELELLQYVTKITLQKLQNYISMKFPISGNFKVAKKKNTGK